MATRCMPIEACNSAPSRWQAGNKSAFEKTRLCKFFASGKCLRGPACSFAHSSTELAAQPNFRKSKLCADFAKLGICSNGADCNFAHGNGELRRPFVPKRRPAARSSQAIEPQPVRHPAQAVTRTQQQQQVDEANAIRAQLELLQSQLQALEAQQGQAARQAPGPEACKGGSDAEGLRGGQRMASAWSRQTTAEPQGTGAFDRQISSSSMGSWADELDDELLSGPDETSTQEASMGVAEAQNDEEEEEEEIEVAVIVEKTFVHVVPLSAHARRLRSLSAPPAACGTRARA